ncbi:hypothetical protein L1987_69921 [Smallanthus sonchifolius]|uniref:Uncharacterized protein n=1 Tax=Smallanthus sonchifolius TaxID=185202 RepID=A0ACB9B6V9_9ASTR|nr:hypothetical protein L1987_69921 [Smallanthus sonchifolius]
MAGALDDQTLRMSKSRSGRLAPTPEEQLQFIFIHAMMAASLEIKAAEFLQGSNNCNFFLPKPLPKSRNSHLLFGLARRKRSGLVRLCSQGVRRNASEKVKAVVSVDALELGNVDDLVTEKVIHFYRTRLIQESATKELLKLVQTKISDKIVGLKTEQCFNIGLDGDLSNEKIVVDGQPMNKTLMQIVKSTLHANPNNSVIGFKDNSSAIKGFLVNPLRPTQPGTTSPLSPVARDLDILFTVETHNFPCAVAPYPGAETGAGGRIRDTHATGRGSFVVASTAGYCVGNLNMEGSYAPWEDESFDYPSHLASPLQILVDASNGASDYGNKFGEPLIQGYTRTFGMRLPSGERRE